MGDGDWITQVKTLHPSGSCFVNRQHHDFLTAFQEGQRVAIDLTAAGVDCNARIAFIISPVFRYIEYFKAFFFAFGNVLVDCCQR